MNDPGTSPKLTTTASFGRIEKNCRMAQRVYRNINEKLQICAIRELCGIKAVQGK
jgi:hypothetical protein